MAEGCSNQAVSARLGLGNRTVETHIANVFDKLGLAPSAHGRWTAAEALADRDDLVTVRALGAALHDERQPWMVRVQCARSLGRIRGELALQALLQGAGAKHPKVRRSVASALGAFRTPRAATVLTKLARRDPSYLVGAEASRAPGSRAADGRER